MHAMRVEHPPRTVVALRITYLVHTGIGFEIDQASRAPMLFARMGRTAQIDHCVGLRQQPQAPLASHPDVLAAGDVEERPAIAKTEALHHLCEQFEIAAGVGRHGVRNRIVNPRAVVFEVVDVEPQFPQSNQVMDELPHHAREWVARGQMQQDDFALVLFSHRAGAEMRIPELTACARRGVDASARAISARTRDLRDGGDRRASPRSAVRR